ncbi:MAG: PxKF domain-containing protein [Aridibacter famidurans]|nr:PxKF domain-containing protein [Aridibacter famidurans]
MKHSPFPTKLAALALAIALTTILSAENLAADFVVDRNDDDGSASACTGAPNDCSLRGALSAAVASAEDDNITFDPVVFAADSFVRLAGRLSINGGGAILIDGSDARLVTVDAQNTGGVFFVGTAGNLSISNLSITGGSLNLTFGGGIDNRGVLNVSQSTFYNNRGGSGGAIFNNSGSVTISNSTLCSNNSAYGGAYHSVGTAAVTVIRDSTICSNTATYGGGIYVSSGSVSLENTIIANNSGGAGGPDVWRTVNSLGFNLIGNSSGMTLSGANATDRTDVDPMLDPAGLADNGGNSLTVALLPESPAIDTGYSLSEEDQRGGTRPVDVPDSADGTGNLADTGAFEVQYEVEEPPTTTFEWGGFRWPIRENHYNLAKAGWLFPVKFSLNGFQGMDILAEGSPTSVKIGCYSRNPIGDPEPIRTHGNPALKYNQGRDFYKMVWKTKRQWRWSCRRLSVTLSDGSVHSADFLFW